MRYARNVRILRDARKCKRVLAHVDKICLPEINQNSFNFTS